MRSPAHAWLLYLSMPIHVGIHVTAEIRSHEDIPIVHFCLPYEVDQSTEIPFARLENSALEAFALCATAIFENSERFLKLVSGK